MSDEQWSYNPNTKPPKGYCTEEEYTRRLGCLGAALVLFALLVGVFLL